MTVQTWYGEVSETDVPLGDGLYLVADGEVIIDSQGLVRLGIAILSKTLEDATAGCSDLLIDPLEDYTTPPHLTPDIATLRRLAVRVAAHDWIWSRDMDPWAFVVGLRPSVVREELCERIAKESQHNCPLGPGECKVHMKEMCVVASPHRNRVSYDLWKMGIPSTLAGVMAESGGSPLYRQYDSAMTKLPNTALRRYYDAYYRPAKVDRPPDGPRV
jgi:hypothetical protein